MIPTFDGHNDTLLVLLEHPDRDFGQRLTEGHIDVVRAREGGLAGGMFAMFTARAPAAVVTGAAATTAATPRPPPPSPRHPRRRAPSMATTPCAPPCGCSPAAPARGGGPPARVPDADDVEAAMADGVLAAVPHIEGAEAVVDLDVLEALHALGLRSLGPVWSRPNAYATGVPFAFPGTPDVGTGLTAAGRDLVAACDRLRIVLDVSHLNEAGFWELLARASARWSRATRTCTR
jgi:membrane dipeptidase